MISRNFRNFTPFFWYQHVPLTLAQHLHAFALSRIRRLSSKRSSHMLCTGSHQQLANIKLCLQATAANLSYKSLPSYTQHSITSVSKLSNSSALHFCVSASFNTQTSLCLATIVAKINDETGTINIEARVNFAATPPFPATPTLNMSYSKVFNILLQLQLSEQYVYIYYTYGTGTVGVAKTAWRLYEVLVVKLGSKQCLELLSVDNS